MVALAAVALAVCLYASAAALLLWAVDLDRQYARTAYPAPPRHSPIDRCHPSYPTPGCLP